MDLFLSYEDRYTILGSEASVSNCMNSIVRSGMVKLKGVLAFLTYES